MKNYSFAEQRLIGFADGGAKGPEMQVVPQKEKAPESTDTKDKSAEINEKAAIMHSKMDKFQSLARRLKPAEMKQWQESLNRRVEDINKSLVTNQVEAIKKIEAALEDLDVIIKYQEAKNTKDVVDVVRNGDEVTVTVPLMRKMKPTQVCAVEGTGPRSIAFVGQNEKGWQWKINTPKDSGARAKIYFEDGQTMTVDIHRSGDYRDNQEGDLAKTELKKVNKVEENPELTFATNRFNIIKTALDQALDKYKKSNFQTDLDAYRSEVNDAINNRRDRINDLKDKSSNNPVATLLRAQIVALQNDYLQPYAEKKGKKNPKIEKNEADDRRAVRKQTDLAMDKADAALNKNAPAAEKKLALSEAIAQIKKEIDLRTAHGVIIEGDTVVTPREGQIKKALKDFTDELQKIEATTTKPYMPPHLSAFPTGI